MPPKTKKKGKTYTVRLTFRYQAEVDVEAKTAQEAFTKAENTTADRISDDVLIDSEIVGVRDND